jgi:flagellar hook-associated protein 2
VGTIQSSVGLVSGINSQQIIDQLLQIEARPRALAQQRLVQIQSQQAAFLDINTSVQTLASAARSFNAERIFRAATATSSNESVLTASARTGAAAGSYDFVVDRLVSTDSAISRGFADRDSTGLGLTDLSFELGGGRLDADTALETLNGGLGVARGKISITDSSGASTNVDLSRAVTVSDVLEAINSASGVAVRARVDGNALEITDQAGGGASLVIADVFGSTTASDLGIAGSDAGGTIAGSRIQRLGENTSLAELNDGNGVAFGDGGQAAPADFIINVDGTNYNIILGEIGSQQPDPDDPSENIWVATAGAVSTVGELIERIETQTSGAVEARVSADGSSLELVADPAASVTVSQGPTANTAAIDLGFVNRGSSSNNDTGTLSGRRVLAGLNTTLASNLAGGSGIGSGAISITTADANTFFLAIDSDDSVADIIDNFNQASGGAATASLNDAGNGLRIVDNTTGGGQLVISDLTGTAAADLGIETAGADGALDSGNLQSRYVSEATLLADLRGGQGIGTGAFRVIDSSGQSAEITINENVRTVRDLISRINGTAGVDVTARVNDTGDGILIEDAAGGASALSIENISGNVASNLNLAGTADLASGDNQIDGSFETRVEFDAGDTLQDVVNAINDAGAGVSASIVASGSGPAPYRLVITSQTSGAAGRVTIDSFGEDLGLSTLSRGEDAVVFFGSEDPANGFLLTSRTNSLEGVIDGVTLDLQSASDDPVEVNVARDVEAIETGIGTFVESFNRVIDRVDFHTRFVEDTNQRGALLGDSTAQSIKSTLTRLALSDAEGVTGQFRSLTQVGVTVGEGGKLQFDEQKFRDAYSQNPEAVRDLVSALDAADRPSEVPILDENGNEIPGATAQNTGATEYTRVGVMEKIAQYADSLTDFVDGRITRRRNTFDNQIELQQDRIENLTAQLNVKRARLEQQFLAMEQAISALQGQQQALGQIGAI